MTIAIENIQREHMRGGFDNVLRKNHPEISAIYEHRNTDKTRESNATFQLVDGILWLNETPSTSLHTTLGMESKVNTTNSYTKIIRPITTAYISVQK